MKYHPRVSRGFRGRSPLTFLKLRNFNPPHSSLSPFAKGGLRGIILFWGILGLFLFFSPSLFALPGTFNHPEVKWEVLETAHFRIFHDKKLFDVAEDAAEIAESVFIPITTELGYIPSFKVPLILIDYDEEFNGSAEPFLGRMVIYCSSASKATSGRLSWLRRLIAHEFSHIITFGAMGAFGGLGQKYQALAGLQVCPIWFLEGIAQYFGESWDTHRDMFLRMNVLEDKIFPLHKLSGFVGTDIAESRLVYEQGHSMIRYIARHFGREKIKEILLGLRENPLNLNGAIKKALNMETKDLYQKWLEDVRERYAKVKEDRDDYTDFARQLTRAGLWNYHAVFSPDGKDIVYASSKNYDYAICDLYSGKLKEGELRQAKKIATRVDFFHSFSPDGKKIIFSKGDAAGHGSWASDLYQINLDAGGLQRLTYNARVRHPVYSPDGKKIAYVVNKRGATDIYILDLETKEERNLTKSRNYEQNDSPYWSQDGRYIAFSRFSEIENGKGKRNIALIDLETEKIEKLTDDFFDDRSPVFLPADENAEQSRILFTSDREEGIPNLYLLDRKTEEITQLTNVIGGVFEPAIDAKGERLIFSGFGAEGFNLYLCYLEDLIKNAPTLSVKTFRPEVETAPLEMKASPMESETAPLEVKPVFLNADTVSLEAKTSPLEMKASPLESETVPMESETVPLEMKAFPLEVDTVPLEAETAPLITYPYNSFANIHFIYLLPAITITNEGLWGGVSTYFLDPLEKHLVYGYSYFDGMDGVHYWQYVNRSFYPTLIFQISQDPYYYIGGNWARYRMGNIEARFPLGKNQSLSFAFSSYAREEISLDAARNRHLEKKTVENNLGLSWSYFSLRERVDSDFNPAGGRRIALTYLNADPLWGSDWTYNLLRLDWREYFDLIPAWRHTLGLRLYAEGVDRYYLSFPRDDNTLRGIGRGSLSGNRLFAASLEYRLPLFSDLGMSVPAMFGGGLFGLYFERFYFSLFADYGGAWFDPHFSEEKLHTTLGMEFRLRLWIMSKYPLLLRFGAAQEIKKDSRLNSLFSLQSVF